MTDAPAQAVERLARTSWAPCISMLLLSFISYVDRSVLSILSPSILKDLGMSATQYGFAISVFSICYMVANPLWGHLIDRVGLSVSVITAVTLWSFASGAHSLMGGLIGMCFARGLLGFGEGATFPAGLKTVAETLPAKNRSFGLGLAYSGGSLGAALTPLAVTPIALRFGWRAAFFVTAAIGFVWILGWKLMQVSGRYVPINGAMSRGRGAPRISRPLLATAAAYGLGAFPLAFGLYAAPLYLGRELHLSQKALGLVLWIPPLGWEVGYLVWGRVADLVRITRETRRGWLFGLLCAGSVLLVTIPFVHSLWLTMMLFFFSMFVAGGYVVLALTYGMAMQGEGDAGFLSGFSISSWSLGVAVLMPVLGRMFDQHAYLLAFCTTSAIPLAGTIAWALLDPPRRART